eukprot:jgi/Bigna1/79009/fgenesh1_pg.59_\
MHIHFFGAETCQVRWQARKHDLNKLLENKLTRRAVRSFVTIAMLCLSLRFQKMDDVWNSMKLALKFGGLSTSGLSLLTGAGLGSSRSKAQRLHQKMVSDEKERVESMKPTVEWADDFNRNSAVQLPKFNSVCKSCQWTVVVAKHHPSIKEPVLCMEQNQIERKSTVPDIKQCSSQNSNFHIDVLNHDHDRDHLADSLVAKCNVRSAPSKLTKSGLDDVHAPDSDECKKLHNAMIKKVDGPRHVHWSSKTATEKCGKCMFPALGWWHSCKQMNLTLWARFKFANEKVFKGLFPVGNFCDKPECSGQIVCVFSLMREAARKMKQELDGLHADLRAHTNKCIHCCSEPSDTESEIKLRELLHLLRHFMPVTQDHGLSMKNDMFETARALHTKMVLMFANFEHRERVRNTLCFDMVLRSIEQENGQLWKFIKTSPNWFNEESGETLNSMLATKMNRDPKLARGVKKQKTWEVTRKCEKGLGLAHLTTRKDDFDGDCKNIDTTEKKTSSFMRTSTATLCDNNMGNVNNDVEPLDVEVEDAEEKEDHKLAEQPRCQMRIRNDRTFCPNDWNEFDVEEETDDDPTIDSSEESESSFAP